LDEGLTTPHCKIPTCYENVTQVKWVGHVAHIGEIKNIYKIFIGIPEGKRQDGRPGHRWESNIRTDLRETRGEGVDWIHLAQDRDQWWALVNIVMNLWVP
jgi:hypothetical protein